MLSKMLSKELIAVLLVFILVFSIGCSSESETSESGTSGSVTDKVTIQVTYPGGPEEFELFQNTFNRHKSEFENIEMQLTHIPPGEYWDKVNTMFAARSAPDVLFMSEPFRQYATQGRLLDLGPYIEGNSKVNIEDWFEVGLDFFKYEGKQYGLPKDLNTWVIFYNEDLFKKANLKTPWEFYKENNWTWETYLDAAKKLTTKGNGKVTQYGSAAAWPAGWSYSAWVFVNGGKYLSDDYKKCLLNSPEAIETFKFTTDLTTTYGVAPKLGEDPTATGMTFATGRIAMEANGSWNIPAYHEVGFKWDIAPMPIGPSGKAKGLDSLTSYCHNAGWSIAKDSKHPEEAWQVLELFTSEEVQKEIAQQGIGSLPPRKSIADSDLYLKAPGMPSHAELIPQMVEKSLLYPFTPSQAEIDRVISNYGEQIVSGRLSAQDAANKMVSEIDAILSKEE